MEIHKYSESHLHSSSYANLQNRITWKASHSKFVSTSNYQEYSIPVHSSSWPQKNRITSPLPVILKNEPKMSKSEEARRVSSRLLVVTKFPQI